MKKKFVVFLVVCVSLTVGIISSIVTHYFTKYGSNDEIYVTKTQYNMLMKFFDINEAYEVIKDYYYKDVSDDVLVTGAIRGMVQALGDKYSSYYTKEEFSVFNEKYEGTYIGLGMSLTKDPQTGYLKVNKVFSNTPAQEAGIKVGDSIKEIDGKSVIEMDIDVAVQRMRYAEGAQMELLIESEGKETKYTLEARSIMNEVVTYKNIDESIGYIKIDEFSGNCAEAFEKALTKFSGNTVGIIIDLRGNPGGFVDIVQETADMLLENCIITYTQNKQGERTNIEATEGTLYNGHIMILVNGASASGAEMFAGAMQANKRAVVVGTQTYGKGVMQSLITLPSTGAGIKITSATYFAPNGNEINGVGITPDVVIDNKANEDSQLNYAVTILKQYIPAASTEVQP